MNLSFIFTDHMVLQANLPIRVFGEGAGDAEVHFCGNHAAAHCDGGKWVITLPAMPYGGPYEMSVCLNGEITVLRDIYIGEVWFAGGQSNMEMPLFAVEHGFEFAKHAKNDMLRLFTVPRRTRKDVRLSGWHFNNNPEIETSWQLCEEGSVLNFSAIGYLAARQLQERLGVAVGVISCNYGGTMIEPWIEERYLEEDPALKPIVDAARETNSRLNMADYETQYRLACESCNAHCDGDKNDYIEITRQIGVRAGILFPAIDGFTPLPEGPYHTKAPSVLFHAMTERIVPYGFRGVMWYQGEANTGENYCKKYLAYMQCMKAAFQNPDLKFYAMELASFGYAWKDGTTIVTDNVPQEGSGWPNYAFTREQQYLATRIAPNNYVVTTMELGDFNNVHSIHKEQMAQRLALKILKYSYGFDLQADQPVAVGAAFRDGKAYITVEHAEGLFSHYPTAVDIFVGDETGTMKKAQIEFKDNMLILSSPEIKQPTFARYAFDRSYLGRHIYNAAGLPLAPFRTDHLA